MSIVVMKRKVAASHRTMSAGLAQFSLNGTHRSQGWVGQNVAGGRHFDSHQGPHRFGRWLAGHVDVKFDSAAHLGRSCCHVRPVDPGLH